MQQYSWTPLACCAGSLYGGFTGRRTKPRHVCGDLKRDLRECVDALDHCLIIETGSLKEATLAALESEQFKILQFPFRPTAENMAKYFHEKMQQAGYRVKRVTVYETPNNAACYEE